MEGLIIAIDLAAVIAKMTSKTPSYNRMLEAQRKKLALRAAMNEEDAADAIDLRRAERESMAYIHQAVLDAHAEVVIDALDAWKQVEQWRIRAWVEEQTTGQQSRTPGAGSGWQPPPRHGGRRGPDTADAIPVKGHSLSHLVDDIRPHERMPVPMAPPLARVAWIGTGLLSALGSLLFLVQAAHANVAGGWLVLPPLAAALALAIYSRGFRRGPAWAHRAAFSTGRLAIPDGTAGAMKPQPTVLDPATAAEAVGPVPAPAATSALAGRLGHRSQQLLVVLRTALPIAAVPFILAGAAVAALANGLDPIVFGAIPAGPPSSGQPAARWHRCPKFEPLPLRLYLEPARNHLTGGLDPIATGHAEARL